MFYGQYDNADRVILYEKYKLVERTEPEVNGVWRGAHLLLFFLAFVFGSFCTFCFHVLMYLFDEKCVLFPKLMSLASLRQNIIYEFIPEDREAAELLPVDFLSTQWAEQSACHLPTYVPLVSGICGLVWTTMFLMCSLGSSVLTGLRRPWRVLPPVLLFSVVMGIVCMYTSAVTHYGLQELCVKLNEITGSSKCSYTINVVTLAYQRRIRGVYQATRLTIASAWLHTACWLLSALLAALRILLAVDFKLVRVRVELRGNFDRMLERHERQLSTISPVWTERMSISQRQSLNTVQIHFMKKGSSSNTVKSNRDGLLLHYTTLPREMSESALVTNEGLKLNKLAAIKMIPEEHQFIARMLYKLLENVDRAQDCYSSSSSETATTTLTPLLARQYGKQKISSTLSQQYQESGASTSVSIDSDEEVAHDNLQLQANVNKDISNKEVVEVRPKINDQVDKHSNSKTDSENESSNEIEPGTSKGAKKTLKSSLKHSAVQTDEKAKEKCLKVHIDSRPDISDSKSFDDKETQTLKEKQD